MTEIRTPGKKRPVLVLPHGANIPPAWKHPTLSSDKMDVVIMPGWGTSGHDEFWVHVDLATRIVTCDQRTDAHGEPWCKGFHFLGYCHHTRGLIWQCYKPMKRKGVQDTSFAAFRDLTDADLNARQKTVYEVLAVMNPLSDKEIARLLNWSINCITPRRGELLEMGAIYDAGRVEDPSTGKTVHVWAPLPFKFPEVEEC